MTDWIKCSDRLPELEKEVLAWDGKYIEKAHREPSTIHENGWYWTYYDYMEWKNVMYWMPLPNPPKEGCE